jgi:hypothetical protein
LIKVGTGNIQEGKKTTTYYFFQNANIGKTWLFYKCSYVYIYKIACICLFFFRTAVFFFILLMTSIMHTTIIRMTFDTHFDIVVCACLSKYSNSCCVSIIKKEKIVVQLLEGKNKYKTIKEQRNNHEWLIIVVMAWHIAISCRVLLDTFHCFFSVSNLFNYDVFLRRIFFLFPCHRCRHCIQWPKYDYAGMLSLSSVFFCLALKNGSIVDLLDVVFDHKVA